MAGTASPVISITIKAAVPARTFTNMHFEDSAGNTVTEVMSGDNFYVCGRLIEDTTGVSGAIIYTYVTDSAGSVVGDEKTCVTDSNGNFKCGPYSYSVSADTVMYFRAFDEKQI